MKFSVLFLFYFLASVLAWPGLTPPSKDKFYEFPKGYKDAKLGDILGSRKVPGEIRSTLFEVKIKNAWQLQVRSEDTFGNPNVIITTVFEPFNADSSKLVSYQIAEDAVRLDCAPSFAVQNGNRLLGLENAVSEVEMFLIQTALNEGYYVVSPDYQGPKSAYTAGRQAGKATLDSIRAALHSSNTTGIDSDAKTILWGYSGGAIAGGWAAAMQPTYASDLKSSLIGCAVGGLVNNVTETGLSIDGGPFSGFIGAAFAGLVAEYNSKYDAEGIIKDDMSWLHFKNWKNVYNMCLPQVAVTYVFQSFFSGPLKYFKSGVDLFKDPTIAKIVNDITLANDDKLVPEIPVAIFQGKLDIVVPYNGVQRVYDTWCKAGMKSIELAGDATGGHTTSAIQAAGASFGWIKKTFNGEEPVVGCHSQVRVSNALYPGAIKSVTEFVEGIVKNVFGADIGPNGSDKRDPEQVLQKVEDLSK